MRAMTCSMPHLQRSQWRRDRAPTTGQPLSGCNHRLWRGCRMPREDLYRVMDLKALRCFWALGRRESVTQAGIDLGISEPAVSQRVKALQLYLSVKLYEVRGGRVALTAAGQRTLL